MFKDLMQAIFTEEVDADEEETVTEETKEEKKETADSSGESTTVQPSQAEPAPVYQEPQIQVFGNAEKEQPQTTLFTGLDVDSIASEDPRPAKKKLYRYDRSKARQVRRPQEDLEYTPVISPIFGNMKESQKDTSKVHNAIDLNKPEQIEDYMTVISPMYGDREELRPRLESIPKKEVVTPQPAREGLSLDDMLEKGEKYQTKQATLFSEDDKR